MDKREQMRCSYELLYLNITPIDQRQLCISPVFPSSMLYEHHTDGNGYVQVNSDSIELTVFSHGETTS
jgi:hypothetical protein